MEKVRSFIKTTLVGGFLVVLPFIVLIFVLDWLYQFLIDRISIITNIIIQTARLNAAISSIIAIVIILLLFFVVGLVVETKIGKFAFEIFEERVLVRIPLYKIIKETIRQLFGKEKFLFKYVALVNLFDSDALVTGFVTDEHPDGYVTVFVPSGPAPTAGFIYHLKKEKVHKIDYPVDDAMRSIFSLGAGSKGMIDIMLKKNGDN